MGAPSDELEDEAALLSAAGVDGIEPETVSGEVPCCPACGRPTDDVSKMSEADVLQELKGEFYRNLLRSMRAGQATHQEMAIARGILRDNKIIAKDPEEEGKPKRSRRKANRLEEETYSFSPKTLDETAGG